MATGGGVSLVTFLLFLFAFIFVSSSSAAHPLKLNTLPLELRSFNKPEAQQQQQEVQLGKACSYMVKIKTSCSSRRYTHDAISIDFGDAYGNDVYVPRLDDSSSRTFERCSTDSFKIKGPCGYGICYMYLRRIGRDGWIPDSVKVYETTYGKTYTYNYGNPLPNNIWYGFNNCRKHSSSDSETAIVAAAAAAATADLVFHKPNVAAVVTAADHISHKANVAVSST